jgi:hypothetical protein
MTEIEKPKKKHDHNVYMKAYMAKSDFFKCDCGGVFKQYSKHIHNKSKTHLKYILTNPNPKYYKLNLNLIGSEHIEEQKEDIIVEEQKDDNPKIKTDEKHIKCSCGGKYDKSHQKRHEPTLKHKKFIDNN